MKYKQCVSVVLASMIINSGMTVYAEKRQIMKMSSLLFIIQ